MKLGGDAAAGIRDGNQYAVRKSACSRGAAPRAGFSLGRAPLPEVRLRAQSDHAACGRVLQRIIQQVGHALLHLLIVEFEQRQIRMNLHFQFDACALKRLLPAAGQVIDAVPKIVFAQLQNQLAALQRRIIQKHRNQPHQPIAAFLRFLQNLPLAFRELSQRPESSRS